MNGARDDELEAVRSEVRRTLRAEFDAARAEALLDEPGGFDTVLWRLALDCGWLAACLDNGESGVDWAVLRLVNEELGACAAALPIAEAALACHFLHASAADPARDRALAAIRAGTTLVCCVAANRAASTDPAVALHPNGRLTGTTMITPFAARADQALVLALDAQGNAIRLLVGLDQPAVTRLIEPSFDNARSAARLQFSAADCLIVPALGAASPNGNEALESLALLRAFEQIGGARACLELARTFALEREAFGQPIGRFQAIKHKLVDMYVRIEIANGCASEALAALDSGDGDFAELAAAARLAAIEAYDFSARECIQTHGAIGLAREAAPHRHYRRARALALELGAAPIWRERLLARLVPSERAA